MWFNLVNIIERSKEIMDVEMLKVFVSIWGLDVVIERNCNFY